jgi:cob(I)alamin adenosyltransferase
MPTRIYTRTGDAGETGLFGDQRVRKDDLRIEACGAVDELNCQLGVALTQADRDDLEAYLVAIQRDLFAIGADIATPIDAGEVHGGITTHRLGNEAVAALEREIDALDGDLPPLAGFILPGGSSLAATMHLARAVCRRAERRCVTLAQRDALNPAVVRYLNRLSDLLFVMARAANHRAGVGDVPWKGTT